jgi:hypothetical protein
VQEEDPAGRSLGRQLEAAVPVGILLFRVGGAAAAVAHECISRSGGGGGNDFFIQLGEQPIFEAPVALEGADLGGLGGGEFRGQRFGVPRLRRLVAAAYKEKRDENCREALTV